MSSTVFTEQNPPFSIQTRQTPIRNNEMENTPNRPSLKGKLFRNFFRKTSSSPTRSTIHSEGRSPPPAPIRQRSSSPSPTRTAMEAPHLRAPIVNWPFGKKKPKLTGTTSEQSKRKISGKKKKTLPSSVEISNPVYQQEYQTEIRGQNFVPRTPELTHGAATGRTQSSSSYETPTKGFRDYMILDHTKSSQQVVLPDVDAITPPPYTSDRSRSPTLQDTSIEHSYYHEPPIPITEIELIPKHRQYTVGETSLGATTQVLFENNPLRSSTGIQPAHVTINSDQWKNTSHSSLNNIELHSTGSSMDVDVPKLNAPLIPLGSRSSKKEVQQTHHDDISAVNNLVQTNRSTYSSLPETNTNHNESFTSLKSNSDQYPTLSAIVEHHIRRIPFVHFNEHSTTPNSKHLQRFDTSTTTTFNDYDQQIITNGSPSSLHRHDGYIRPLTPPKSPIQPDVSTIHIDLNDLRGRSSSSHYNSLESPIIYRSSTIIYTRDKHNYGNGGELRTWSVQQNDNLRKPSTSIQIFPSRVTNEYHYNIGGVNDDVYQYERPDQYSNLLNNSNMIRSSMIDERDQYTRSYKVTAQTQEPILFDTFICILMHKTSPYLDKYLNPRIPTKYSDEKELRHYTLKRTNKYDGLGIYITTDAETRLKHRIHDLEPNSPGAKIGLRINDRITHVNGINVENTEFGDVLMLIKQGLINNNLQFSVINE